MDVNMRKLLLAPQGCRRLPRRTKCHRRYDVWIYYAPTLFISLEADYFRFYFMNYEEYGRHIGGDFRLHDWPHRGDWTTEDIMMLGILTKNAAQGAHIMQSVMPRQTFQVLDFTWSTMPPPPTCRYLAFLAVSGSQNAWCSRHLVNAGHDE